MSTPKTVSAITEDDQGNVTGCALSDDTVITLPPDERFPRSELRSRALELCARYNVTLPGHPALTPPVPDGA